MSEADIAEMFAGLGPVTIRRMFGGKGIYHAGLIVAVELRGEMMLKANERTGAEFAAAGARRWVYEGRKGGKPVAMPYWSVPDEAWDDPDAMAQWVRLAFAAARENVQT